VGWESNSWIYIGKDEGYPTGIPIRSNTRVALEIDTQTGTLSFFIGGEQIACVVKGVPKDVYFGVCCYCDMILFIIFICFH
jgi:hypothetical protein